MCPWILATVEQNSSRETEREVKIWCKYQVINIGVGDLNAKVENGQQGEIIGKSNHEAQPKTFGHRKTRGLKNQIGYLTINK